jgi:hypothetical protein
MHTRRMRTVVALTVVLGLGGCTTRQAAMGLGAAAVGSLVYGAVSLASEDKYCANAFGGDWGFKHECSADAIAGFSGGILFGIAAVVVWAKANHASESVEALQAQGRVQRVKLLGAQAHDAAVRGDCEDARERANRVASIDPTAVRTLVLSDAVVRACLGPATNRAP